MAEIGQQTVGNIDHRMRGPAQRGAERYPRFGGPKAGDQGGAVLLGQFRMGAAQHEKPEKRVADSARDPDHVAGAGAAAADLHSVRDFTDRGQRQYHRPRRRDRIAAQQRYPEMPLVLFEPARELRGPLDPEFRRQCGGNQVIKRPSAHRREVRQVDSQQLFGDQIGRIFGQKMYAGDDRVRGHDQPAPGPAVDQGGVVEQPEPARAGKRREIAPDALKLAQRLAGGARCHRCYISAARKERPSRSSTPLARPGSLPIKKAWAIAMYSLIETRAGTSARCTNSQAPARRIARNTASSRANGHSSTSAAEISASSRSWSAATPRTMAAKNAGSA